MGQFGHFIADLCGILEMVGQDVHDVGGFEAEDSVFWAGKLIEKGQLSTFARILGGPLFPFGVIRVLENRSGVSWGRDVGSTSALRIKKPTITPDPGPSDMPAYRGQAF